MSPIFIICLMLFAHVIADYNLQGILASMKQKSWWIENFKSQTDFKKYRYDYIAALVMHSISWSFMIMLPIAIYYHFDCDSIYLLFFILNTLIHAIVDHYKANRKYINLIDDQWMHMCQISITFSAFLC